MAVTATEQWIKEKLDIKTDILNSIQSLSLAGTYHQKITHLERSLLSFSSLSNLDLSRNNLESLEVFITGVDPSIMSF